MTDTPPPPAARARARATLGVGPGAPDHELRRAFRALARRHHPDHGGDAEHFDRIRRAFALLGPGPATPPARVGTGRPSRGAPAAPGRRERTAPRPLAPTERAALLAAGRALDATTLVRSLLGPDGGVVPLRAASRAPGARINRVAHALAEGSTSRLTLAALRVDGTAVLRTELVALPRRARRALDALRLEGAERGRGWVRTRGSSAIRLHQDHDLGPGAQVAVLDATDGLVDLLERLTWPLSQWRVTG